jgi:hypothetical protein
MRRSIDSGEGDLNTPKATNVWLGANFWSRAGGPRMWTRYDGAVARDEPIVAEGVELRLDAEALTVDPFGVAVIPCRGALRAQGARAVPQEAAAAIWVNEGRDARE